MSLSSGENTWGVTYKASMKHLDYRGFREFRIRGIREKVKHKTMASRGCLKLLDILNQTRVRPFGKILSLCSGRGGWDQVLAPYREVKSIYSVTYGPSPETPGHENYADRIFDRREKVNLVYCDARKVEPGDYNWVLFDGGESHDDAKVEAERFHSLLVSCVDKHIKPNTDFILKILTPCHEETLTYLESIQARTNRGAFVRSTQSRTSNLELYFVSVQRKNLRKGAKTLLTDMMLRAHMFMGEVFKSLDVLPLKKYEQPDIEGVEKLQPLNMEKSIAMLGAPVAEGGRDFRHYESLGVYPMGIKGSSSQPPMPIVQQLTGSMREKMRKIGDWRVTDTTPRGFHQTFMKKVDTVPVETHIYNEHLHESYLSLANYYRNSGFRLGPMTYEEVALQANKQGAPRVTDHHKNVGDFLEEPDWENEVKECEDSLVGEHPIHGVWSTMGKREKKSSPFGPKGSRMIAYLPIGMRLVELKNMGRSIELTKPAINKCGVGGMGLHDYGERMKRLWKESAMHDDIAGWDTRVSGTMLDEECAFILSLIDDGMEKKERKRYETIIRNLYRMYKYTHLLIPMESEYVRSELVRGFGQRMSGSNPTYAMNSISRLAVLVTVISVVLDMHPQDVVSELMNESGEGNDEKHEGRFSAMVSGDDCAVFGLNEDIQLFAKSFGVTNEMGMIRKDIGMLARTPVKYRIENVEFCSHRYESVTYFDSSTGRTVVRQMPTRDVTEIMAKTMNWLGARGGVSGELAWLSAQGNNLIVNYHHLRLPRILGLAYKATAPPDLVLDDEGPAWKRTPWMREGDLLRIVNDVLFGVSTRYPVEDFVVMSIKHLGFLKLDRESHYLNLSVEERRTIMRWKAILPGRVINMAHQYGGDISILDNSGVFALG